jgi:hypothetical protein
MIRPEILKKLINIEDLPTLPEVKTRILQTIQDDHSSLKDLTAVLELDHSITAHLLRIANSPFYGFSGKISSLKHAVVLLDFEAVEMLAIATSVFSALSRRKQFALDPEDFWMHSLGAAKAAQVLCAKHSPGSPTRYASRPDCSTTSASSFWRSPSRRNTPPWCGRPRRWSATWPTWRERCSEPRTRKAEQEKADLEMQLRQAQRMEAVGMLAGGIAHDFNNILYAILGCTELAMKDLPAESPIRERLAGVIKAATRAADLVSQILAFGRQTKKERKSIRIQDVIEETLKMMREVLPATIDIRVNVNTDCGPVFADPTEIQQVIMNLCTNSRHAMREHGGTLTVNLDEVKIAPNLTVKPARRARKNAQRAGRRGSFVESSSWTTKR